MQPRKDRASYGLHEVMQAKQVLLSVADQLHQLTVQLQRAHELAATVPEIGGRSYAHTVAVLSESMFRLTDAYKTALSAAPFDNGIGREPVAVSALLYETERELAAYARHYGVQLEIDAPQQLQLVAADTSVFRAVMVGLGQVFVRAAAESADTRKVKLAAHRRSRRGIVVGVYSGCNESLDAAALRRAVALGGRSTQPFAKLSYGPNAEVALAQSLLKPFSAALHVGRFRTLTGLATTLPAYNQMSLSV